MFRMFLIITVLVANTLFFLGIYREVPGIRIPGGSEDVMMDLGVRQLVKNFKNKTKALERPSGSSKL